MDLFCERSDEKEIEGRTDIYLVSISRSIKEPRRKEQRASLARARSRVADGFQNRCLASLSPSSFPFGGVPPPLSYTEGQARETRCHEKVKIVRARIKIKVAKFVGEMFLRRAFFPTKKTLLIITIRFKHRPRRFPSFRWRRGRGSWPRSLPLVLLARARRINGDSFARKGSPFACLLARGAHSISRQSIGNDRPRAGELNFFFSGRRAKPV